MSGSQLGSESSAQPQHTSSSTTGLCIKKSLTLGEVTSWNILEALVPCCDA